jgi:hypothetical protein
VDATELRRVLMQILMWLGIVGLMVVAIGSYITDRAEDYTFHMILLMLGIVGVSAIGGLSIGIS